MNGIIEAMYISEWTSGERVETPCKVNTDTREVFVILYNQTVLRTAFVKLNMWKLTDRNLKSTRKILPETVSFGEIKSDFTEWG